MGRDPRTSTGDAPDVESDGWTLAAQTAFDEGTDRDLATTVVYAIAAAEDVSPRALKSPVLYDCVDVEAVQTTLFDADASRRGEWLDGTVRFTYEGYVVTVDSDGWVQVYQPS